MRNFFTKSTVETDVRKRVCVREGTFENTGVEDGVADMIIMAQVCAGLPAVISDSATPRTHTHLECI